MSIPAQIKSRDKFLNALRKTKLPERALPDVGPSSKWLRHEAPHVFFEQSLGAVGGTLCAVPSDTSAALDDTLARLLAPLTAAKAAELADSGVSKQGSDATALSIAALGVPTQHANVNLRDVARPQDLESLDVTVVRGELGVAENGAVWVTDQHLIHRAALVICQHLIIVLDRNAIVTNMHEAYARISIGKRPYGVFVSGPSKTADIEQSLVIGAHGPRSATVCLIG
jgi:L-lactate dehydrogenase complex protein LldG